MEWRERPGWREEEKGNARVSGKERKERREEERM